MNPGSKTLIILTPGFPANEADSTCLPFPQLFVKKLQQLNPSLNIIVLAFQYPFFESEYDWNAVRVIAFNGQNKGRIHRLLLWRAVRKKLTALIKENNILGILNFWLGECSFIGKWAANKYHVKSFTWLLGQDARKGNRYYSLVRPPAGHLVALSDAIADEFYKNYKYRPAHIIMPGIDTAAFPVQPGLRDIDILGVGSLIPLKQYHIFIQVVVALAKERPLIKTLIVGQGTEKDSLQQLINQAGLSANITLCGELPHSEVLPLIQRSKILLHPSSYEGFATVYAEALYAGAHVVGFCQPMHSVFNHLHIVPTTAAMIEKVNDLLNDPLLAYDPVLTNPVEATIQKLLLLYGM